MRRVLCATVPTYLLLLVSSIFSASAAAQCMGVLSLGGVSTQAGSPFQAEVTETFVLHNNSLSPRPGLTQQVARDSQGRVRIERAGGKFKVEAGAEEGTEQEQHHISICDPVKQEFIVLDTLNKTATIQKWNANSGVLRSPGNSSTNTDFCSRQLRLNTHLPGIQIEDLGHRTIEDLDAHGAQQKRNLPITAAPGEATQVSVSESWCSEELGAIVLRTNGTEAKGTTSTATMTNIQRGEPDPLLFQIPPDYRIVERVNEPGLRQGVVAIGGFGSSGTAEEVPAPPKP